MSSHSAPAADLRLEGHASSAAPEIPDPKKKATGTGAIETVRVVSDIARAILGRQCEGKDEGLIWWTYDYRSTSRTAAKDAGCFSEHEITHLSLHDLRHGAITELASVSPNLPSIARLAGHLRVTTTNR